MTRNERRLTLMLIWLIIAVVFIFLALGRWERIKSAQAAIKKYSEAMEKLPPRVVTADELEALEVLVAQLRSEKIPKERIYVSIENLTARLIEDLKGADITPLRYRISGEGERGSVEFSLRCSTHAFLAFLRLQRELPYVFSFMSIRPSQEEESSDIEFRARLDLQEAAQEAVPGETAEGQARGVPFSTDLKKTPGELLRLFHLPPPVIPESEPAVEQPQEEEPEEAPVEEPEPLPESADSWLSIIGEVTDSVGVQRLYFKNSITGKILILRTDGIEEGGARLLEMGDREYLFSMDDMKYTLRRKP